MSSKHGISMEARWILLLIFAIAIVPAGVQAAVHYVDGPTVITEPGYYMLVKDITGYNGITWENGTDFFEPAIKIQSSDVIFTGTDTGGVKHTINGHYFLPPELLRNDTMGIYVEPGLARVTVQDVIVNGFNYGIYYYGLNQADSYDAGGRIDRTDVKYNDIGITADSSCRITIADNIASECNVTGILLIGSDSSTLEHNTASLTYNRNPANGQISTHTGILLLTSNVNTLFQNTADSNFDPSVTPTDRQGWGIRLGSSSGNTLNNNTARHNPQNGIELMEIPHVPGQHDDMFNTDNNVVYNFVEDNGRWLDPQSTIPFGSGIYVEGMTHANNGNLPFNGHNSILYNNAYNNYRSGINVTLSDANAIIGNHAWQNRLYGISVDGSHDNSGDDYYIGSNTVWNNVHGIELGTAQRISGVDDIPLTFSSDRNLLTYNIAHDNSGAGIYLNGLDNFEPMDANLLTANEVYNNDWGILLHHANSDTLTENFIHENRVLGLSLSGFSSHNVIYNNIFNNAQNAGGVDDSSPNTWNVLKTPGTNIVGGPFMGGNYWGQPDGMGFSQITPDAHPVDGICDNYEPIGSGTTNADYFPLKDALIVTFYGSPTSGSSPLPVQFYGTVNGQTGNNWLWDFGDGNQSSSQNPSHTFYSDGTPRSFTVSLTAFNNGWSNSTTKVNYINVGVPAPTADFIGTPQAGTYPLTVTFTDKSVAVGGFSIDQWQWDFGDGTTGPERFEQNPIHHYMTAQDYTVTLTVTNSGGMSDTETKTAYITDNVPQPIADFTATPRSGEKPLQVSFTDLSTGQPTAWEWDFEHDGIIDSTDKNPQHTYDNDGLYTVSMRSMNSGGWSDWMVKSNYIGVNEMPAPVAAFNFIPKSGTKPLTVNFIDQSTGDPATWYWSFGDGGTSPDRNPVHVYSNAGTYYITLTVSNEGGSSTSAPQAVVVNNPSTLMANFNANPMSGLEPLTVQFTDTSQGGPTSWFWEFGDGLTSNLQSPQHTYQAAGYYTPKLTVSNAQGQNVKVSDTPIWVKHTPPVAYFTGTPTSGTVPLTVTFTDQSTGQAITSWHWVFGDGSTSTDRNPIHTYQTGGLKTVTLTVANDGGSHSFTRDNYINAIVAMPVAAFTANRTSGPVPFGVHFIDESTGSPPLSYFWRFGDGATSTARNPDHTYTNSGRYTVNLTVTNEGGSDSEVKTEYITADGPDVNFVASPTSGTNPLSVQFTDLSVGGPTSWVWHFGDGQTGSTQNPVHLYTSTGTFTVTLMASNQYGTNSKTIENMITVSGSPTPPPDIANLTIRQGWNFVSVPAFLASGHNTAQQVFGGLDMASHSVLVYNASTGHWDQMLAASIVKPRDGIWVYSAQPAVIQLVYDTTPAIPPSKTVYTGWNSIGFIDPAPVTAQNSLITVQGIWNKVVGWDANLQHYETTIYNTYPSFNTNVMPLKGYWLFVNSTGTLS